MNKKAGSLQKSKIIKFNCTKLLIILSIIFTINSLFCVTAADNNPYVPFAPSGPSKCSDGACYEFTYSTTDVGSLWMFDWGDGNFSDWIEVKDSDAKISAHHGWTSQGIYEVRIRHRSLILGNSTWSSPLTVTVGNPTDHDYDGWSNEIEEAYGKNPNDADDYPLDTDGDGTPDDDSLDGAYTGDTDDDNDGLLDTVELFIGSDTKDSSDVTTIVIGETVYYLADSDADGKGNYLYNSQTWLRTGTYIEGEKIYLDINGDSAWDYSYINGAIAQYKGSFPWLYVVIVAIIIVIVVVFILFKSGILYLYEEEYVAEE